MAERHLNITASDKVTALSSQLHEPNLGLSEEEYSTLITRTTHILHCAWPVNFQLGLPAFDLSLRGLHNLISLSLDVKASKPAHLIFCSSISVALGTPAPAVIPEESIGEIEHVSHTGYAQSKLVGERIVEAAVKKAGAEASVYRIGQVVGDTKYGIWNDSEAFPLIIRSALTMGALPELDMGCEWLPVDTCARSIIEIEGLDTDKTAKFDSEEKISGTPPDKKLFYNLRSPQTFSWTKELLPALAATGVSFKSVAFADWIQQLRKLSSNPNKTDSKEPGYGSNEMSYQNDPTREAAADPERNPALKLIDFFERDFAPSDDGGSSLSDGRVILDIDGAVKASKVLESAEHVLRSGLLEKMVGYWMGRWKKEEESK